VPVLRAMRRFDTKIVSHVVISLMTSSPTAAADGDALFAYLPGGDLTVKGNWLTLLNFHIESGVSQVHPKGKPPGLPFLFGTAHRRLRGYCCVALILLDCQHHTQGQQHKLIVGVNPYCQ
jgi:hypothetical protein